jgi:uncharacterized protein
MDWDTVTGQIDADGFAMTPSPLLDAETCRDLRDGFTDDDRYRATIDMARFRFGEGHYRYFRYPLPRAVAALREALYPPLAAIANQWQERLGERDRFPAELADLTARCRAAGQDRATPLVLRYEAGGYNCLHQDLYGEIAFPLQVTVALTRPGQDFTGGENLFVEQRPRSQSRGSAVTVAFGHGVVFPTRFRPVTGARGDYRVAMRHGVSTVRTGERMTLGVIFHDAR